MRKILLTLALITGNITTFAHNIIPFVGINRSWHDTKESDFFPGPVVGFNGGAMAEINGLKRFGLQVGAQYTYTGGKDIQDYYIPRKEYLYRVHSLQIPVMFLLKIGAGRAHFFVCAGFYGGLAFAGKADIQTAGYWRRSDYVPASHSTKSLYKMENYSFPIGDFGLNAGAGYRLANGLEFYGFFQKSYFSQAGLAVRCALKMSNKKAAHQGPR